jgi:hypothetical protein
MPLRTDVEKALDELIAEEQAFKFQGLGVVLAKQKWPRLIASERRYDLGLDAHARGDLEPDGRGMGLACSLTAEYEKIAEDATKVVENYPDVRVLVLATPGEVTKHKEKQWAEALKKEFGLDLVIMPRMDLITSLMEPWNADRLFLQDFHCFCCDCSEERSKRLTRCLTFSSTSAGSLWLV